MAGELSNCHLINAPAGSGKTTAIVQKVRDIVVSQPQDNVLCITFTNRAADELAAKLPKGNVLAGTIHSFLSQFMDRYFRLPAIVDLWFELYREKIEQRIRNEDADERVEERNAHYREEHGALDMETVRAAIERIYYDETQHDFLYYGGLSHDSLLTFTEQAFERFPAISDALGAKYQHIFIDEYQDTSASVLRLFNMCVAGSGSQLYLYGDRMQQIYQSYDGSFEKELALFDRSEPLCVNYRSQPAIVSLLNNIYNDEDARQESSPEMREAYSANKPRLIITDDVDEAIQSVQTEYDNPLVLRLFNRERFEAIDALGLYEAFSGMERYRYGQKYNPVDVLTTTARDNPDPMMKLFYHIAGMCNLFGGGQYGSIIYTLRTNDDVFDRTSWRVKRHEDKVALRQRLERVFAVLKSETGTVGDLFEATRANMFLRDEFVEGIESERQEYEPLLAVNTDQLIHAYDYLNSQPVSTQHGVKGESHESVIFVAENSTHNPHVNMSGLFEMCTKIDIALNNFQHFYYDYSASVRALERTLGITVSKMSAADYAVRSEVIDRTVAENQKAFESNEYYHFFFDQALRTYGGKKNTNNAKKVLKPSTVSSVFMAYKLLYVGCSRARNSLTVIVRKSMLRNMDAQKAKFEELGFEVTG